MCNFEDEIKTTVRDYIADFFNEHLFKAFLYNYSALSQTEHEPQGGEPMSAELSSRTPKFIRYS